MKKARVHREELHDGLFRQLKVSSAEIAFGFNGSTGDAATIYKHAGILAGNIVDRLLKDYTVIRKPRTERTV